jgi:hypothetical protein
MSSTVGCSYLSATVPGACPLTASHILGSMGVDPYPAPVNIVTVVNPQAIVKSSVTQSIFTVLFWAPPFF